MCAVFFWEMNTCLADFCRESFENHHGVHSATKTSEENFSFNSFVGHSFLAFFRSFWSIVVTALNGSLYKYILRCVRHCLLNIKITHDAIKQYFHNLPVIRPHLCGLVAASFCPSRHSSLRKVSQ